MQTTSKKSRQRQAPEASVTDRSMVELSWHSDASLLLETGRPPLLLLVGEPGVGKTTFAQKAAREVTGRSPLVLSGSPEIEHSHIFGRWTLEANDTRFCSGPLETALKEERWLIVEDFSLIQVEVRSVFLPLRDQSELTNPLTGEVLPVPPGFRLVATSNSESLTCRKNSGLAKVLYDGFYVLECGELTDRQVLELLAVNFPDSAVEQRNRVLHLWNEYRDFSSKGSTGKTHLSYRAAEQLMRLLQAGMHENRAVQISLVNKFLPGDPELFSAANLKNSISD